MAEGAVARGLLVLFFFNALLDRLTEHYLGLQLFTTAFYALLGIGACLQVLRVLASWRAPRLAFLAAAFIAFALALGAAYGDPVASVYGVKQFFVGVVLLFVFSGRPVPVRTVLLCVVLVQFYAVFQAGHFLTQSFTLPPWDAAYVAQQLETWEARNLFQGDFVRPFATFASFSEYQAVVHVTTIVLWLARREMSPPDQRRTWLALAMLVGIDVMLPDRTPIMMAGIVLVTALLGSHLLTAARTKPTRLILGGALVVAVAAAFLVIPALFLEAANPGLRRLAESFRAWEAETVRERAATAWDQSLSVIRAHPEGLGPSAVATSYNSNAIVPHSNYFLWAIGYSVVFPFAFLVFLGVAFWRVYRAVLSRNESRSRLGYAGVGLTLAFLAASVFNATLTSYPGAAFFLLMLWLEERSRTVRTPPASDAEGRRGAPAPALA